MKVCSAFWRNELQSGRDWRPSPKKWASICRQMRGCHFEELTDGWALGRWCRVRPVAMRSRRPIWSSAKTNPFTKMRTEVRQGGPGISVNRASWNELQSGRDWRPSPCTFQKWARRFGANPSPRSWRGWHFEEMPGEVRPASGTFSKKARTSRRPTAASAGRPSPHLAAVQQRPAPHPTSLREATLSSFVERESTARSRLLWQRRAGASRNRGGVQLASCDRSAPMGGLAVTQDHAPAPPQAISPLIAVSEPDCGKIVSPSTAAESPNWSARRPFRTARTSVVGLRSRAS